MTIFPPIYQTSLGTPRDVGSLLSMKSQGFGDNVPYYSNHAVWPYPTQGHPGIDWGCAIGTPVYAPIAGTVKRVAVDYRVGAGFGAGVILECPQGEALVWHFSMVDVQVGQQVGVGTQIGLSGNSGVSTAPHVHLEWRPYPLQPSNNFNGAVDPAPLLVWQPLPTSQELMTSRAVKELYKLAFYRLPDSAELAFWTGKPIEAFLDTAIADRAKFLATPL